MKEAATCSRDRMGLAISGAARWARIVQIQNRRRRETVQFRCVDCKRVARV